MANEDRIPGVEFTLDEAEAKKVGKQMKGTVHLTATINDLKMWDEIQDKLDGMKVYTVEDFQEQIISLQQQDNEALEDATKKLQEELEACQQKLEQSASFSRQREEELGKENQALRARVAQLEALERELQDLAGA